MTVFCAQRDQCSLDFRIWSSAEAASEMSIHEDLKHNDSVASCLSTSSQKKLIMSSSNDHQESSRRDPESDLTKKSTKLATNFTPPDGGYRVSRQKESRYTLELLKNYRLG